MTRELRVHGVGGPQEERLLGVTDPRDLDVVALGKGTRIVRRTGEDDGVEGYSWGGLTSSSLNTTPWLVFLPFSLINAAGWACPYGRAAEAAPLTETPPDPSGEPAADQSVVAPPPAPNAGRPDDGGSRRVVKLHDGLVKMLAVAVTAGYAAWIVELLVDLVGWQWRNRLLAVPAVSARPWLSGAVEYGMPAVCWALALGLFGLMATYLVGRSRTDVDNSDAAWGQAATFTTPGFFRHTTSEARRRIGHFAVVGLVFIAGAVMVGFRHDENELLLGQLVVVAAIGQGLFVLGLWVLAACGGKRPVAAGTATLGAILANATFGGLAILAVRYLSTIPRGPGPVVTGGPELGLLEVWLATAMASVIVLVVAVLHVGSRTRLVVPTEDIPEGDITQSVKDLTDVPRAVAGRVRSAERLARLAHGATTPFCLFTATLALGGLAYWLRLLALDESPISRNLDYRPEVWAEQVMAFILVALPIGVGYLLRKSARSESGRRRLGVAWDVLLIWPRRFHPLAITPYAEEATREIHRRVRHLQGPGQERVVVAAHSQGSALAYIALCRPLHDGPRIDLARVDFVTYGSHLNGLYALAFPRHFNATHVGDLRLRLHTWRNFWRSTDPIGGPVFSLQPFRGEWFPEDESGADQRLFDPAREIGPVPDPASPRAPLEADRTPWLDIAGHSQYLAERKLKDHVTFLKAAPVPAPEASEVEITRARSVAEDEDLFSTGQAWDVE